jgi:hypothetical protein
LETLRRIDMWVVTEKGRFYAAVQDWDHPDLIRVRTRTRGDMMVTGFRFTCTPENDYSFLATVPRADWTAFLADAANHIDYPSLKGTVRDHKRHGILVECWAALMALSPKGWGRYSDLPRYPWEVPLEPLDLSPLEPLDLPSLTPWPDDPDPA